MYVRSLPFSDGGELSQVPQDLYDLCVDCLAQLADLEPQYVINGYRNAWILKPAAKSRGRGIQVLDKLGSCLQQAEADGGSMIIQKYIGQWATLCGL